MTSLELSKELKLQHFSLIRAIEQYLDDFLIFGEMEYKRIQDGTGKGTAGGRPIKLYILNEKQKNFLVVLLKNTKESVKLKAEIIKRSD